MLHFFCSIHGFVFLSFGKSGLAMWSSSWRSVIHCVNLKRHRQKHCDI